MKREEAGWESTMWHCTSASLARNLRSKVLAKKFNHLGCLPKTQRVGGAISRFQERTILFMLSHFALQVSESEAASDYRDDTAQHDLLLNTRQTIFHKNDSGLTTAHFHYQRRAKWTNYTTCILCQSPTDAQVTSTVKQIGVFSQQLSLSDQDELGLLARNGIWYYILADAAIGAGATFASHFDKIAEEAAVDALLAGLKVIVSILKERSRQLIRDWRLALA
ncbi:hypothetical protein CERZMDRAFT_101227 [Cercospora zeae-maydis SCOH1-5]|uniref:Uncharacterized protein n=1 Tax=Cercospora zeae-maydis SCOH1-5 TaxID=717836 RepID=A0A6A6F1X8_9PEZI|nr:hypothetical protein CERZMDRAFT_101227 [Cercospora zeae-maydis SCOH1-5]